MDVIVLLILLRALLQSICPSQIIASAQPFNPGFKLKKPQGEHDMLALAFSEIN